MMLFPSSSKHRISGMKRERDTEREREGTLIFQSLDVNGIDTTNTRINSLWHGRDM